MKLTAEESQHFLEHGFVKVRRAFAATVAEQRLCEAWSRMGYEFNDPRSRGDKLMKLPPRSRVDAETFAPAAWRVATELAGGANRVRLPWLWSDGFIANSGVDDDRPWDPPSAAHRGWHVDGSFFRHFLDSPEQGLLVLVLWTDMLHKGGGTFIATDSVPVMARYFADHPEGVMPGHFDYGSLIRECRDFVELTGEVGDVVLLHPFTLHAASRNVLGITRVISNPPLGLRVPMSFNRPRWDDHSLVEKAVLRGLGVDRFDFVPSAPRELVKR